MKGVSMRILVGVFVLACAACTQYADVSLTTTESLVAGCQKVADVSVKDSVAPADVNKLLSDEAREKGANYVLVASQGARTGAAYSCQGPKVASK
jgi:hypothetical protein